MYAPSDSLTLAIMVPYITKEMAHITRNNTQFNTQSGGIGDVKLGGLVPLYSQNNHHIHMGLMTSLPTGSIDEEDTTPAGFGRLPYPMQIGSGTFDLIPSLTYRGFHQDWSWGTQLQVTAPLGRNDYDYSLGNEAKLNLWGAHHFSPIISTSLRIEGISKSKIDGADRALNPNIIQTANTALQGGTQINGAVGVNLVLPEWNNQRLAAELSTPLYQKLNGPQLSQDWRLTLGLQYGF